MKYASIIVGVIILLIVVGAVVGITRRSVGPVAMTGAPYQASAIGAYPFATAAVAPVAYQPAYQYQPVAYQAAYQPVIPMTQNIPIVPVAFVAAAPVQTVAPAYYANTYAAPAVAMNSYATIPVVWYTSPAAQTYSYASAPTYSYYSAQNTTVYPGSTQVIPGNTQTYSYSTPNLPNTGYQYQYQYTQTQNSPQYQYQQTSSGGTQWYQ